MRQGANPYSADGLAIQIRPLARLGQDHEILTHAGVAPGGAAWQSQNDRCFFLAFAPVHTEAAMCRTSFTGEGGTAMRQFSVGEVVTWIPDLFLRERPMAITEL